jgi:hypothetical protein
LITEGLSARLDLDWTIENEAGERADFAPTRFNDLKWIEPFDIVIHNHSITRVADQKSLAQRIAGAHHDTGIPVVVIHGTMHFGRAFDQWHDFTGVVSRKHEKAREGAEVRNLAPDHEIMREFGESWTPPIVELYMIEATRPGVTPLADCYGVQTKQRHVNYWTHQYGKARVFGTTLGHDNSTVAHPHYLDTLAKGGVWVLGR